MGIKVGDSSRKKFHHIFSSPATALVANEKRPPLILEARCGSQMPKTVRVNYQVEVKLSAKVTVMYGYYINSFSVRFCAFLKGDKANPELHFEMCCLRFFTIFSIGWGGKFTLNRRLALIELSMTKFYDLMRLRYVTHKLINRSIHLYQRSLYNMPSSTPLLASGLKNTFKDIVRLALAAWWAIWLMNLCCPHLNVSCLIVIHQPKQWTKTLCALWLFSNGSSFPWA